MEILQWAWKSYNGYGNLIMGMVILQWVGNLTMGNLTMGTVILQWIQ